MYHEEREILLLQREKYKLKMVETLLEAKDKVVSQKGALAIGGTALLGFLAYKGVNWFATKNTKQDSPKELAESNTRSNGWFDTLKEQAVITLLDIGKEQLQKLMTKGK